MHPPTAPSSSPSLLYFYWDDFFLWPDRCVLFFWTSKLPYFPSPMGHDPLLPSEFDLILCLHLFSRDFSWRFLDYFLVDHCDFSLPARHFLAGPPLLPFTPPIPHCALFTTFRFFCLPFLPSLSLPPLWPFPFLHSTSLFHVTTFLPAAFFPPFLFKSLFE